MANKSKRESLEVNDEIQTRSQHLHEDVDDAGNDATLDELDLAQSEELNDAPAAVLASD